LVLKVSLQIEEGIYHKLECEIAKVRS